MKRSTSASPKWRTIVAWVLRVVLGLAFLLIGITKLTGTVHTVDYFEAIGWGQWFRYLTGSLDVAGVALLFMPRYTFYGALVLISSVGTATVLSVTVLRGNPFWGALSMVLQPLILTALTVALAWLTCPPTQVQDRAREPEELDGSRERPVSGGPGP
jgi:putative oxidoreductase